MQQERLNEKRGGFFDFSDWSVIELRGSDAPDYLNRMSTLDFKRWDPEHTRLGAFLNGRSGVVSFGFFHSAGQAFHYCCRQAEAPSILEHLEKFHFQEELEVVDQSRDWALFGVWGKSVHPIAAAQTWVDPWLPEFLWVKVKKTQAAGLVKDWLHSDLRSLPKQTFDFERIRAGCPRVGVEINASTLALEAGLERAIDRNKGCYPGQEVVERIFTYGQVNRKLLPVSLTGDWQQASLPMKFTRDDRPAAILMSALSDPGDPSLGVGLAFVYRGYWELKESLNEANVSLQIQ